MIFQGYGFIHEDDFASVGEGTIVELYYPDAPEKAEKQVKTTELGRQERLEKVEFNFESYLKTEARYHSVR
jgi:hypothetical protein